MSLSVAFRPLCGKCSATRSDEPDKGVARFFSVTTQYTLLLPALCRLQGASLGIAMLRDPVLTHQRCSSLVITSQDSPDNTHSASYSFLTMVHFKQSLDCCQACFFLEICSPLFPQRKNKQNQTNWTKTQKTKKTPHPTPKAPPKTNQTKSIPTFYWSVLFQLLSFLLFKGKNIIMHLRKHTPSL